MTQKTPIAGFEQIDPPAHLWTGRNGSFYRITPVRGARIAGIFQVGMTSHEVNAGYRRSGLPDTAHAPAMWVDLSPIHADRFGGAGSEREPLTINGKTHDARFGARVELIPAENEDWRDEHYQRVTVGGDYFLTSHVHSYDSLSESARHIIYAVTEAIATEYVTGQRWHAQRVSEAEYAVKRATEKRDDAQQVLDDAQAVLAGLKTEVVSA